MPVYLRREGSATYRPHFRVGAGGEYLGVQSLDGTPPVAEPGDEGVATVELMYIENGVDYQPLVRGALFDVLEGARLIGRGAVLRRYDAASVSRAPS
jgi:hypothetical protein